MIVFTGLILSLTPSYTLTLCNVQDSCYTSIPCDSVRKIGIAIEKGLEGWRLYYTEKTLTSKLINVIDTLYKERYVLVEELNKKPKEVTKINWFVNGLSIVVVSILYLTTYLITK